MAEDFSFTNGATPVLMQPGVETARDIMYMQQDRDQKRLQAYALAQQLQQMTRQMMREDVQQAIALQSMRAAKAELARKLKEEQAARIGVSAMLKQTGLNVSPDAPQELLDATWEAYLKHLYSMREIAAQKAPGEKD